MQCGRCAGCCSVPFLPRKCHCQPLPLPVPVPVPSSRTQIHLRRADADSQDKQTEQDEPEPEPDAVAAFVNYVADMAYTQGNAHPFEFPDMAPAYSSISILVRAELRRRQQDQLLYGAPVAVAPDVSPPHTHLPLRPRAARARRPARPVRAPAAMPARARPESPGRASCASSPGLRVLQSAPGQHLIIGFRLQRRLDATAPSVGDVRSFDCAP